MCGIAGFHDPESPADLRSSVVAAMCAAMAHRGPDDTGLQTSGPLTLGMRRLAIFDPANGRQPMQSPDGRYTLVFNGAIYNFPELRAELAGDWTFHTHCDTEVLLAAFVRWGADCLNRLRGMFAFAVWDQVEQTLFLARDPLGIKPLYYVQQGSRLLFASELTPLARSGAVTAEIDPGAVADYLGWLAVPAPRTIYRGMYSLRPGEYATLRAGRLAIHTGWDFRSIPDSGQPCRDRPEFLAQLRGRLEDSVRAHTLADVPVGAFLSGGVDSAAVTGLMARASRTPLRSFCIDFSEAGYSEAAHAEASARHFGTVHQTTRVTGADLARDIEALLEAMDQPTGDGINTYYASQAARAGGAVVALSGLGGDELFGGYPSFRLAPRLASWLPLWRLLPPSLRALLIRRLRAGDTRARKLAELLQDARNEQEIAALQRQVLARPERRALLRPEFQELAGDDLPCHPELATLSADLAGVSRFNLVSGWELRGYMADVLLRDSDVMSMRHSLELRVPLVDRPLLEWLWRQPAHLRHDPRQPKSALAGALRDLLPPEVTERPKRGFSMPFDAWMRRELRPFLEETFSTASVERAGFLAPAAVQARWQGFLGRQDPREWSRIWSLAMLLAFANRRPPRRSTLPGPLVVSPRPAAARGPARGPRGARTLLLAPEIFTGGGGIPRVLRTYLRALCDLAGPEPAVRLVSLNDAEISFAALAQAGVSTRLEAGRACGRSKAAFVRAALALSRGCPRILCGHVAQLPVAALARRLNPALRYTLVAHGIEVWRPFTRAEQWALRGAERILCISDYTRQELLRHCPLPEGRAVVLPNPLDPAFAIAPGQPLGGCPPVILTVTRLSASERYKGVQELIEALPAIRAAVPGARLRIVGEGDDRPRLQALAAHHGLAEVVHFAGYIDDDALGRELAACRLFALPSSREGFGLVYLEAMARGRPCVGARAGGVPEVITAATGVLVEPGHPAAVAAGCIRALQQDWSEAAILAHARRFSYPVFRDSLGRWLGQPAPTGVSGA